MSAYRPPAMRNSTYVSNPRSNISKYIPPFKKMKYTPVVRYKIFVIPYIGNKILMVRDKTTQEWGFISGGVKRSEMNNIKSAAERELFEETSGLFKKIPNSTAITYFNTKYRTPSQKKNNNSQMINVTSKYTVFLYPLTKSDTHKIKYFKPNDEIDDLKIDSYFNSKKRWSVCDEFVESVSHIQSFPSNHLKK